MAKTTKKSDDSKGEKTPLTKIESPIEKSEAQVNERKEAIKRRFPDLTKYKKKINFEEITFKKQEWIKMSHAYQSITKLPGIPVGHLTTVYGKSDVGKTTFMLEAAAKALEQGILPVLIITEMKWDWTRAEKAGLYEEYCMPYIGVKTVESGCDIIKEILDKQRDGEIPHDICFFWDSIGSTPSKAGWIAHESGDGKKAMAETARVLRDRFHRYLIHRINGTREEGFPYNATMVLLNNGYSNIGPVTTLEMYGGDGIYLPSTLIFRMGGILGRAAKIKATKGGVDLNFGIKTDFNLIKNHINGVEPKGKILCVDDGFILVEDLEDYKKKVRKDWLIQYDKHWDNDKFLDGE